jgi:hypothetical protein
MPANPQTLSGGQIGFGTSINNTGTDSFLVYGPLNIVDGGAGNLIVNGEDYPAIGGVFDNQTTVNIAANVGAVADTVALDGGKNTVSTGGSALTGGSTINVTVQQEGNLGQVDSGANMVYLNNLGGTTNVSLTGAANQVYLNSDATNTVTFVADPLGLLVGGELVSVGFYDDDNFGYSTKIALTGSGNEVIGQTDANVTVTGGVNNNAIFLGDGKDAVSLSGRGNYIQVGGGNDTITAGSGNDAVVILGIDSLGLPAFVAEPDDAPVPSSPNVIVNLAGANNTVNATYENVTVNGAGGTGNSIINLGGGQNNVFLGGDANYIFVGNGANTVATTGNNNYVIVTDPTGVSTTDAVSLSSGTGNTVSLDHAGGQVTGTDGSGSTTNTVVQAGNATNNVNVDLLGGTGIVILGNGSDQVRANGAASFISLGNGNDTVTANGNASTVIVGTGNDTITANGNADHVTVTGGLGTDTITANGAGTVVNAQNANGALTITANGGGAVVLAGNGNDTITANGGGAVVIAGNGNDNITANGAGATVIAGSGNDVVSATGTGSTVNIGAGPLSVDTVTMGSGDVLRMSGGTDQISGVGNDFFFLNNLKAGSTVLATGSQNFIALGGDSSTEVVLDPAQIKNTIVVQALNSPADTYGGVVEIQGFTSQDMVDLQSLKGGIDGALINSFGEVLANLQTNPTNYTLKLAGGGAIQFDTTVPFSAAEFGFSSSHGLV